MNTKAVISIAGFGTRFFPVTIGVNKTMLPIGSRPVIDYLLMELAHCGVSDVAFVTLPGDDQVRRYVEPQKWIKEFFQAHGWQSKYNPVEDLHERLSGMRFEWIEQPVDGRYGTAVPAILAREWVGDSDFFLLSGDDVVFRPDGGSDLADLMMERTRLGVHAGVQVAEVPSEETHRYGIIADST